MREIKYPHFKIVPWTDSYFGSAWVDMADFSKSVEAQLPVVYGIRVWRTANTPPLHVSLHGKPLIYINAQDAAEALHKLKEGELP